MARFTSANCGLAAALLAFLSAGNHVAIAGTLATLHVFNGPSEGSNPSSGVVLDSQGNIYGENSYGGSACPTISNQGCGSVYKVDPSGVETTLVLFNGSNGAIGMSAPTVVGNKLYGTAAFGGVKDAGLLFSTNLDGSHFTILHSFSGPDGAEPTSSLVADRTNKLYGTAMGGGSIGGGVLFSITPDGTYTILHNFSNYISTQEYGPQHIVLSSDGVIFGSSLGKNYKGAGEAGAIWSYKIATGEYRQLLKLKYSTQGSNALLANVGTDGALYGVTQFGGPANTGLLFSLDRTNHFQTLHIFNNSSDGVLPGIPLQTATGDILDANYEGGPNVPTGTIWQYSAGLFSVIEVFPYAIGNDGCSPNGPLALSASGQIFGSTANNGGGDACGGFGGVGDFGSVFRLSP